MKPEDFNRIVDCFHLIEKKVSSIKSRQYSDDNDRLYNFKEGAKDLNIDPITHCRHLMQKHLTALKQFCEDITEQAKYGKPFEFPVSKIVEYVKDIRLYCLLLFSLIAELSQDTTVENLIDELMVEAGYVGRITETEEVEMD